MALDEGHERTEGGIIAFVFLQSKSELEASGVGQGPNQFLVFVHSFPPF